MENKIQEEIQLCDIQNVVEIPEKVHNLVREKYLSSTVNQVVCIDYTQLGQQGFLLTGIDLATRCVVTYAYSEIRPNSDFACMHANRLIRSVMLTNPIQILHSDKETIFFTPEYRKILKDNNVEQSAAISKSFGNQVVERLHRSLKNLIRMELSPGWTEDANRKSAHPFDPLDQPAHTISDFGAIIKKAADTYNNRKHRSLFGMKPLEMCRVLHYERSKREADPMNNIIDVEPMALNDESKQALKITAHKVQAINEYYQDGIKYVQIQDDILHQKIDVNHQRTMLAFKHLHEQNIKLYEKAQFLEDILISVSEEIEVWRQKRLKREEKHRQYQERKVQPLREPITNDEFEQLLFNIKGNSYAAARRRCAHIILYASGMRIGNLKLLTVAKVKQLMQDGKVVVPSIKKGPRDLKIVFSAFVIKKVQQFSFQFAMLLENKEPSDPFFTTGTSLKKPINRSSFDTEINKDLAILSDKTGKNIKAHSYRVTMITDVSNKAGIQMAKQMSGHKSMVSTSQYVRGDADLQQYKTILDRIHSVKKQVGPLEKPKESLEDFIDV